MSIVLGEHGIPVPRRFGVKGAKPFIKWAGGKKQLSDEIVSFIDSTWPGGSTYFEPFMGGGSIFFALQERGLLNHSSVVLADANRELVAAYIAVRDRPSDLVRAIKKLRYRGLTRKAYEAVRASRPRSPIGIAARFIYLNKTGFNGLYRVNSKGGFNVPWGKKKRLTLPDEEGIELASRALQEVTILCQDFGATLALARPGDFVYLDPPYVPISKSSSFTDYQAGGFDLTEQARLRDGCLNLQGNLTKFLLSNSDTPKVHELYAGFTRRKVLARRNINSKGDGRGAISELLISP